MKNSSCKTNPLIFKELKFSMYKRRSMAILSEWVYYPQVIYDGDRMINVKEMIEKKKTMK